MSLGTHPVIPCGVLAAPCGSAMEEMVEEFGHVYRYEGQEKDVNRDFFLFILINFYWSRIYLQHCVSFKCAAK